MFVAYIAVLLSEGNENIGHEDVSVGDESDEDSVDSIGTASKNRSDDGSISRHKKTETHDYSPTSWSGFDLSTSSLSICDVLLFTISISARFRRTKAPHTLFSGIELMWRTCFEMQPMPVLGDSHWPILGGGNY